MEQSTPLANATSAPACVIPEIIPDQSTKIRLAKAAQVACIVVQTAATVSLCYQIYQNPSRLNPWSEDFRMVWFSKDHLTCIVIGSAGMAGNILSEVIRRAKVHQSTPVSDKK